MRGATVAAAHPRRGASLVEILVCLGVVCAALMPVVLATTSSTRKSSFSEHHFFWQVRAMRILEKFAMYDYATLVERSAKDGRLAFHFPQPACPAEYSRMLKDFTEACTFEEKDGLGTLTVTIRWSFPLDGEGRSPRSHELVFKRVVCDPVLTWKARDALDLTQ